MQFITDLPRFAVRPRAIVADLVTVAIKVHGSALNDTFRGQGEGLCHRQQALWRRGVRDLSSCLTASRATTILGDCRTVSD